MNAAWMDSTPWLGQAGRLDEARALASRPGLSFIETSGGRVRIRSCPSASGPRLLLGTDGPNVIEHCDALVCELEGRADLVIFEPPGTGASVPARGFDFTVEDFVRVSGEVLEAFGPRTLVFPCYLGLVGQELARRTDLVSRVVMPQTPSWRDLARWASGVDPKGIVRTPVVGQVLVAMKRRSIAEGWYRASTGEKRHRAPFLAAAVESFALGGCYCLASLMQGFERSPKGAPSRLAQPAAVVWGTRDRTHRHSDPERSCPGAEVVRFDHCGHCPELEDPRGFSEWLLRWHETAT